MSLLVPQIAASLLYYVYALAICHFGRRLADHLLPNHYQPIYDELFATLQRCLFALEGSAILHTYGILPFCVVLTLALYLTARTVRYCFLQALITSHWLCYCLFNTSSRLLKRMPLNKYVYVMPINEYTGCVIWRAPWDLVTSVKMNRSKSNTQNLATYLSFYMLKYKLFWASMWPPDFQCFCACVFAFSSE